VLEKEDRKREREREREREMMFCSSEIRDSDLLIGLFTHGITVEQLNFYLFSISISNYVGN
jgi:hypothetical protein